MTINKNATSSNSVVDKKYADDKFENETLVRFNGTLE